MPEKIRILVTIIINEFNQLKILFSNKHQLKTPKFSEFFPFQPIKAQTIKLSKNENPLQKLIKRNFIDSFSYYPTKEMQIPNNRNFSKNQTKKDSFFQRLNPNNHVPKTQPFSQIHHSTHQNPPNSHNLQSKTPQNRPKIQEQPQLKRTQKKKIPHTQNKTLHSTDISQNKNPKQKKRNIRIILPSKEA